MNCTFSNLEVKLQDLLPTKRFRHTIGVAYTCASLAMKYGVNIQKAMAAGYFHDYAKYMSSSDILEKCKEFDFPLTKVEGENPQLLHGKLSAFYAKRDYDLYDEDILKAITYHTTGYPDMNTLDKILFIADYIEPNRKNMDGLEAIRQAAFEDLDKAVILKIESVISYLRGKDANCYIDNLSMETYIFYKGAK